ncbi:hypothetical protein FHX42_005173 [Saccharopolyspora lacisalsi]|uniref:MobA/VirD2-like nuclease domain-containing protein n=1 Tax=Halosaccharopolyspora lacisalsi TaxID=1000566 RepID=A0A839E568_9PSEU|nr:relaxase/mobilization nuclease domain-containing protein [Halosaccharopolyspora lacisalsi]MBA8827766.1 hypothetical protein [Halosaccharopolyspora lacisalsi]
MIDRVYKGWDPGGLIWYLFGPGRYSEHENPRVVATWDNRPQVWQPEHVGPGEFDYDTDALVAAMQAPLKAARLPVTTPTVEDPTHRRFFKTLPDGSQALRDGTVRHLTLRNEATDRPLSDEEWAHIAEEMMHRSGWARRDDPGAARWAAVRHDDEGIHIVAVLVRQDTGKRMWPRHDYTRLRKAAEAMEQLYGVTSTAPADQTAAATPSRAEEEKAARSGQVAARTELREAVSQAASSVVTLQDFQAALTAANYEVALRYLPSGDVAGYKVARKGDVNAAGNPIWFSGSQLASDLSWPKLARRWSQARRGRRPETALDGAGVSGQAWVEHGEALAERARRLLLEDPEQVHGITHAVSEVWAVLDHSQGRLISGPGARWDRAARQPYQPVPETSRLADELRWLARGIGSTDVPSVAAMQLAAALAALALQIASLLSESGRAPQQARAARQTSRIATRPPSRPVPRPSQPVERAGRRPGGRHRSREMPAVAPTRGRSSRQPSTPPPGWGGRPGPAPGRDSGRGRGR